MNESRVCYEIQIYGDDRWSTVELRETESMAMALAKDFQAKPQNAGVRVVRNWRRADGLSDETIIFSETRAVAGQAVTAVPITDAHLCSDIYDFYGFPARHTFTRLFRRYLDMSFLTASEVLHHVKAAQKLQNFGNLFQSGVDRVAALQGDLPGQNHAARRELLYDVADKLIRRVGKLSKLSRPPRLEGDDLGRVLDQAQGLVNPGREGFYAQVALAEVLAGQRNWLGKLDLLARIVRTNPRPDVLEQVDMVLADLILIPAAFQDLAGYQGNLGQTLMVMADLFDGCLDWSQSDARDQMNVLGPLIGNGHLPQCRDALLERLLRGIRSPQPLDRHDPSREKQAFRLLQDRMGRQNSQMRRPDVDAAMKERARRLFGAETAPAQDREDRPLALDPVRYARYLADLGTQVDKIVEYPAGSVVFREGETGDRAYMILAGSVEISTIHKTRRVMLAQLGEGAVFGELALFGAGPRQATVVTVAGCRLRVIDRAEMNSRVAALDAFSRHWVSYLLERISDLSARAAGTANGGK